MLSDSPRNRLNREIDRLIAGFRIADLAQAYGAGPRPFSYLYKRVAESGP
jgi:hypothetical protein